MGYTPDAPVSLGRNVRRNENCVVIADDTLWRPIWERVRAFMPREVDGGAPAGLNQRWRLYKYGETDVFRTAARCAARAPTQPPAALGS